MNTDSLMDTFKRKMLYHYCDMNTFVKILQSNSLWMTSANNFEDMTEFKVEPQYVKAILDSLKSKYSIDENTYNRIVEVYAHDPFYVPPFVVCFSNTENNDNQWREYGDNAGGICIGVAKEKLIKKYNMKKSFHPCNGKEYSILDVEYLDNSDKDFYGVIRKNIERMLSSKEFPCIDMISIMLDERRPFVKMRKYEKEDETRIIYNPSYIISKEIPWKYEETIKTSSKYVCPHDGGGKQRWLLDIKDCTEEIYIGLKNNTTVGEIRQLLQKYTWPNDIYVYKDAEGVR